MGLHISSLSIKKDKPIVNDAENTIESLNNLRNEAHVGTNLHELDSGKTGLDITLQGKVTIP